MGPEVSDRAFGFDTRSIHAGQRPDPETGARAMPIYQTTSYVFDDPQHAADLFALQTFGNIYTRIGNPTTAALEERVASLEGGIGGLATASGMSAQLLSILTVCEAGDHLIANRSLYGGTFTQFDVTLRRMGIQTTFVDTNDLDAIESAITDNTRLVYGETIGNPAGNVLDIEAMSDLAHANRLPLFIDNTFATPALCRPIEYGADVVVHSATKFIGGHGGSHRRGDRGERHISLGQWTVPGDRGTVARLSRSEVLGELSRVRVSDEGAHRAAS